MEGRGLLVSVSNCREKEGRKTSQIIWDFPFTILFMIYDTPIDYGYRKWKDQPLNLWIHMENSFGKSFSSVIHNLVITSSLFIRLNELLNSTKNITGYYPSKKGT